MRKIRKSFPIEQDSLANIQFMELVNQLFVLLHHQQEKGISNAHSGKQGRLPMHSRDAKRVALLASEGLMVMYSQLTNGKEKACFLLPEELRCPQCVA